MKIAKLLVLTTAITMAVTALAGVGSAYAVDQEVVLCTLNVLLCPGETEIYNSGESFLASSGKNTFLGPLNEICESGHIKGKTLASMAKALPVDTEHSLIGCAPCTLVLTKSSEGTVTMDEESGKFLLTTTIETTFSGCSLGAKCTFRAENVSLEIKNTEAGTPQIAAEEEELKLKEGLSGICGGSCKWDALYVFSSPKSSWFSLYELKK
jgi:hypothetical protein